VSLAGDYDRPVVVMNLNSRSGSQPCHIRLRNVQGRSFEFQIEEWDYLNQIHRKETISYLVVESGTHTLSGGTLLEADRIQTDHSWETVLFRSPFDASPVVFSQAQTENGAAAIVTRQRDIGPDGLEIRVQEEEAKNGLHKTETIGYIVIER
jgi:hypothetical protein